MINNRHFASDGDGERLLTNEPQNFVLDAHYSNVCSESLFTAILGILFIFRVGLLLFLQQTFGFNLTLFLFPF